MTREEAKHATKILQAYIDCKKIEEKRHGDKEWHEWYEPFLDFEHIEYRIKPEKKYVPYKSVEEVFADANKHNWKIREAGSNRLYDIYLHKLFIWFEHCYYYFIDAYKNVTWEDGTPFGKEVTND